MKILAIRGENLASLEGRFDIQLDCPQLGSGSGLFAITGPTGAGKSTLLDAACLALFNHTPRLGGGGTTPVDVDGTGADLLKTEDVRSILRRGAGSARAEVEFRGQDGETYTAAWAVRRANGKAHGRLQKVEMSLKVTATGRTLAGGNLGETQKAIEGVLGLTYDQFTRSALLAQGDFARFLRAKEGERAELLERMTGAEIYGHISIAAFNREKKAHLALAAREDLLGQLTLLQDQELEALVDRKTQLGGQEATALAALKGLEQAVAWYGLRTALAADQVQAQHALAAAVAADDAAAPVRQELAAVDAAQSLRGPVEAAARLGQELAAATVFAESQRAGWLEAETARDHVAAEARTARELRDGARRALDEAAGPLAAALRLDQQIEIATGAAAKASQDAASSRTAADAASVALQAKVQEIARLEGQRDDALAYLARHAEAEPVVAQWDRFRASLERYRDATLAIASARAGRQQANRDAAEAREAALAAGIEVAAATSERDEARARVVKAQQEAGDVDRTALGHQAEELRGRLLRIHALAAVAGAASDKAELAAGERNLEASSQAEATAQAHQAQALEVERDHVARLLEQAEGQLKWMELAKNLAAHRPDLVAGEPCPLCGSLEHPLAGGERDSDTEGQARVVKELRERNRSLAAAAVAARTGCSGLLEAAAAAATRASGFEEALAALREEWRRSPDLALFELASSDPGIPPQPSPELAPGQAGTTHVAPTGPRSEAADGEFPDPAEPGVKDRIARILAATEHSQQGLAQELDRADRLASAIEAAQRAAQTAQDRVEQALSAQVASQRQDHEASRKLADLDHELAQRQAVVSDAVADLAVGFADVPRWREDLENDPVALHSTWTAAVEQWRQQVARRDEAQVMADRARLEVEALRARFEAAEAIATESARTFAERDAETARLQGERRSLLDGRTVDQYRGALESTLAQADAVLAGAEDHLRRVEGEAIACQVRQTEAQDHVSRLDRELAEAVRVRDQALALAGLDLATVNTLLARNTDWQKRQRDAISALRDAVTTAGTVLGERERRCREHDASGPPQWLEVDLAGLIATGTNQLDIVRQELLEVSARMARELDHREQAGTLRVEVEALRQQWSVWASLDKLIGSADGAKFRRFAQGLTMDVLVFEANRHLGTLAPRYQLKRQDGTNLDLKVVDLDMAREVRALSTLSGGETFLVSLALALALSSLASRNTRIESLFIDEGFGSLDARTLETALASLDALQSTGCQVGLISHVGGLAERIGAQIEVLPKGAGRSHVRIRSGRGPAVGTPRSADRLPVHS